MHARVVRFTNVDPKRLKALLDPARRPPVKIPATRVQVLHDATQKTAVVIQHFDTAADMAAAEGPLNAMNPADTPGTRASVDRCEIEGEFRP